MGDKVVDGLAGSVRSGAADFQRYRKVLPDLAAQHKARGMANVVHDFVWHHVAAAFDELKEIRLKDDGVTRELLVRADFRLRLKKHRLDGRVSSYPTKAALNFFSQDEDLFGSTTWNLAFGYAWDEDLAEILYPVLSLRDGTFDHCLWMTEFPAAAAQNSAIRPPLAGPPSVEIRSTRTPDQEVAVTDE